MSQWLCLTGNHDDATVKNGFCEIHGPTKTNPVDDAAKDEADVPGAAANREEEERLAAEAEARNQASIELSQK